MTDESGSAELRAARDEAAQRVTDLRRELDDVLDSASSTTVDDEHDPEGATIGYERARAQALLDSAVARLAELDAALTRPDYGRCVVCGNPIGAERLAARPGSDRCVVCAAAGAIGGRRYRRTT